jgi:hypothetical protein
VRCLAFLLLLIGCPEPIDDDDDSVSEPDDDDSASDDDDATAPGPCTTWGTASALATVDAPWLDEISGLAVSQEQPGVLWVIEDSGNEPEVVALSEAGAVLARATLEGRSNRDWEDLALGPCDAGACLFVADIGDNAGTALEVALLRLPEPMIDQAAVEPVLLTVPADRLPFTYAEGPQDAEALVIEPDGTPVVLTKRGGGTTRVYRLDGLAADVPAVADDPVLVNTARKGGPISLGVTGADLLPDGSRLLVREYFDLQEFELPDGVASASPKAANPVPFEPEGQGEAVAYDAANRRYLHVSEAGGGSPPIYEVRCTD